MKKSSAILVVSVLFAVLGLRFAVGGLGGSAVGGTDGLGNSGVTAATYTNPTVAVNAQGIITSASSGSASSSGGGVENILINGGFAIMQRQIVTNTVAYTDDKYCADRMNVLTQTAAVNYNRVDNPYNGARYNGKFTQNQVAAQRLGVEQIVEGKDCIGLRGQAVTFSGKVKISNAQDIRVAILEWNGTEDSPTSDVVADWASTTYTTNGFFIATTTTVTSVAELSPSAATWTDFSVTGTLGSAVNNVIVFLWTEGTAAQNVTLETTNWQLEKGSTANAFQYRPMAYEWNLCKRYCQAFAGNNSTPDSYFLLFGMSTATTTWKAVIPGSMRVAPTITYRGGAVVGDFAINEGANNFVLTALAVEGGIGDNAQYRLAATTSGMTQFRPGFISINSAPYDFAAIVLDSEL